MRQASPHELRVHELRVHELRVHELRVHELCQHKGTAPNQEKVNISNTDYIHSCETPKSHNISVPATSTPPSLTPLITTLPILPNEVPKTTLLPPLGKEYLCF